MTVDELEREAIRELVERIDWYLAEADAATRDAALDPIEATLAGQLADWWAAQAALLLELLEPYADDFPAEEEAISGDSFDPLWDRTVAATDDLIVPLSDAAAAEALAAGIGHAIADIQIDVAFDLANPRAVAWLEGHGADLVARINDTTRTGLRSLLAQAAEEGWSWQRTGQAIEDRFAGFSGDAAQAHLRTRAELVATTEMADAYGAGNDLVRQHLAGQGLDVEKRWTTIGGGRVCPQCTSNQDAGWVPAGDSFPAGAAREPQHPGCRCVTTTRVLTDPQE